MLNLICQVVFTFFNFMHLYFFLEYHDYTMKFDIQELIKATNARVIKNVDTDGNFSISTDTRTITSGDVYLPIKGANFDGEKFCQTAIEQGAAGCFVTTDEYPQDAKLVLKVDNTLHAYMAIANYVRTKFNPKTVAITGSSGKTTTKEMVYSVVSEKFKTHKTFSNHNNEIGFCQTLLSMPIDTEVLIVEMGMRGLGEIELLSKYAQCDYSIIVNVGSAHIGRLGSLDNIAKAKCEITKYQRQDGVLIANDSERIRKFVEYDGKKIFYSIENVKILDRKPSYTKFTYKNEIYELHVEGDYNVENALAAIEFALQLNMTPQEIKQGLLKYKPIEKRWEVEEVKGLKFINDSYNANPDSMKASVSTFVELYNNPVVVLGNMGELGDLEVEFHKEVGDFLGRQENKKQARFITVGSLAKYTGEELAKFGFDVKSFDNNIETSRYILDNLDVGTTIFLKASRTMKFEEIIQTVKEGDK